MRLKIDSVVLKGRANFKWWNHFYVFGKNRIIVVCFSLNLDRYYTFKEACVTIKITYDFIINCCESNYKFCFMPLDVRHIGIVC